MLSVYVEDDGQCTQETSKYCCC